MGFPETMIIYSIFGAVVAAAIAKTRAEAIAEGRARAVAELIVHLLLWPIFAPGLFGRAMGAREEEQAQGAGTFPRVDEARERLRAAIGSLGGLGEQVIKPQLTQIDAMMSSLTAAAGRLADMEEMLATPEFDVARVDGALANLAVEQLDDEEPRVRSLRARRNNIDRLRRMRDRTSDELERALLEIEEISSQVFLLKFADHPESKLARLLGEVSASIEDLAGVVLEMSEG